MEKKKTKKKTLESKIKIPVELEKEIKWTPEMSVHENTIDKQHQSLISKFNELLKDATSNDLGVMRGVISAIDKYYLEHFTYEEAYMLKHKFPGLETHKKLHQKFTKFFLKFKDNFEKAYRLKQIDYPVLIKLAKEVKKYLLDWIINHVLHEDRKYAVFIEKNEKNPKIEKSFIKSEVEKQLQQQRAPVAPIVNLQFKNNKKINKYIKTGVPGFDELFQEGIPKGNTILIAGGAGSGKTIFCLQTLADHASKGEKCFYMSFEESEERLVQHMNEFGWNADKLIKSGKLKVQRVNPFDITRNVDAMLAKEKGELLIDIEPVILPANFKPDFVVLDSLTAISSAFAGREDSYRIYIEQLFRFFERLGCTAFLITETEQVPKIYSTTGVEEFLADGVIVFYNIKRGDVRENAIEVLKMRGEKHQKKIVAMQITNQGIIVYPEQEVFGGIE